MKLILIRHGESLWNLENKFTGWKDVDLTEVGKKEATSAGNELIKMNYNIESVYTSLLTRATMTAEIICSVLNFSSNSINYEWRLNERHYGALQGLNKSETAKKYGEKKVLLWRRSFDIRPPLLEDNDKRHPKFDKKFKSIDSSLLPIGESLSDVIERLNPFWEKYIDYIKSTSGDHIIVAHSNSLRAIIKILDNLNNKDIISLNIPTGIPLVYSFDKNMGVLNKKYLIDENELKIKQSLIADQGKKN